ncbi:MAG: hypothetical protein IPH04_09585 [Saprospirales bacterium]|nr:hypothetical protein [Saprospirales bacterium]
MPPCNPPLSISAYAKYARLRKRDEAANIWSGNLGYMALGFPLETRSMNPWSRKYPPSAGEWGFPLVPYSTVGYDIQTREVQPGVDTTLNNFQDGRNLPPELEQRLEIQGLCPGPELGYFFGKLNYHREVIFEDLGSPIKTMFDDAISVGGTYPERRSSVLHPV